MHKIFLLRPILDRGFASDVAQIRALLSDLHHDRTSGLVNTLTGEALGWFTRVGEPGVAAVIIVHIEKHPESIQLVSSHRADEARTVREDFLEVERTGAAMDFDQLVEYLLGELDRIAATTAPTGEDIPVRAESGDQGEVWD